uniref:Putative secreted peptide n=1 Tax=Anopheles braziliensis TaxID=58242 RepID=A0A2M3ZUA7_9DIPT
MPLRAARLLGLFGGWTTGCCRPDDTTSTPRGDSGGTVAAADGFRDCAAVFVVVTVSFGRLTSFSTTDRCGLAIPFFASGGDRSAIVTVRGGTTVPFFDVGVVGGLVTGG